MTDATLFSPFHAWRYDTARAGGMDALVAPPYDVIAPADVQRLLAASPHNVVRLELPSAVDADSPYDFAARTWREWTSDGILKRDTDAQFYIIRHSFTHGGGRVSRIEVVGAVRLAEWEHGSVLPHEHTHDAAKRDRLMLMNALHANISPIIALYQDQDGTLQRLLTDIVTRPPASSLTDQAGDAYDVWHVSVAAEVEAIQQSVTGPLFIADGHHRYETALEYLSGRNGNDVDSAGFIMTALTSIDDPGLLSLPYHRLLRDVPDDARARLARQVETYFTSENVSIAGLSDDAAARKAAEAMLDGADPPIMTLVEPPGDVLRLLRPMEPGIFEGLLSGESDAWSRLAPCVFLDVLLTHGVGADQQQAESRGWLSYPRDAAETIAAVRAGGGDAGFLLQAVSMADMTEAAAAGERLPPKSTYFFPKAATGIVLHSLAG